tara:strand:- start:103 stop:306 length:204 start_codon:yes stop_codon:yes gene_type:complete
VKSYVSIHDVSPQSLNYIPKIIEALLPYQFKINKICILVIPGLNWNNTQIETLKSWQNSGIQIAAHG